ncbi:MAG: hypothetical protein K2N03_02035 [Muribaculaceae bacterium]|nr:hypothetical protein [Muribaculaceae bacterium]
MKKILSITFLLTLCLYFSINAFSKSYLVVAREGRVFDQPNNKSYPTTNKAGDNVVVQPGMVFPLSSDSNGWSLIQYTPGLQGYIFTSISASDDQLTKPVTGKYVTVNSNLPVVITKNDERWEINDGKKVYTGVEDNNAIIFKNEFSNITYTLVNLNNIPIVMDYNNEVTKFF